MKHKLLIKFDNGSSIINTIIVTDEKKSNAIKLNEKIPIGEGFLFVFEEAISPLMFWNKGFSNDIELLYIDSNLAIRKIDTLKSNSTDVSICGIQVKYVIEVPIGTCKEYNLKVGSRAVDFERLKV